MCAGEAQRPRLALDLPAIEDLLSTTDAVGRAPGLSGKVLRLQGHGHPRPGEQLSRGNAKHPPDRLLAVPGVRVNMSDVNAVGFAALGVDKGRSHLAVVDQLCASPTDPRTGHDLDGVGNAPVILDEDDHLPGVTRADEFHARKGKPHTQGLSQAEMAMKLDTAIEKVFR